jgi:hypothetical protein
MTVLLLTVGLLLLSLVVHLTVWRICLPRGHTTALLVIFLVTPIVSLIVGGLIGLPLPATIWDWILAFLVYVPCTLTYICLYSLLEHRSPTVEMVDLIQRRGGDIAFEELRAEFVKSPAIGIRITQLVRSGVLAQRNDSVTITPRWRPVVKIIVLAAAVLGLSAGGA